MRIGKKLKNRNGFTLIELIAVIAILGIILLLALPQVSKIQQANKNRKYEAYEMSMERGAKLYTDSNARDMFGNNNSGCVTIPYSTLKSSNVIKDFSDSDITCSHDSESYVRIRKINDDYRYDIALICRQDGEVVYKQEIDTTFTCTNSPDTEVPIIEASPSSKSDWVKPEDLSVTIKISDASGLNKNASIKYYWVNTAGVKVGKEYTYNYNNKEGVTKVSYKIPKKNVVDVTGEYYLVIEPYRTTTANGIQDVLGNDRVTGEQFGTYKIDNTKPSCGVADGAKTTWTNTDFTITQYCSDGESGCVKESYSKKFTTSTTTHTFTIKDNAGNETTCPTQQVYISTKPNKPTIYNPTNENWVNYSFTLTVSTTTSSSVIGYWQYSYDNSTWTTYANSATNNFVTTNFSQERNQLAYIRVCTKAGVCSDSATTYIRIDKTKPSLTYSLTNDTTGANYVSGTWSRNGVYRDLYPSDAASGVKEVQYNNDGDGWYNEPNLSHYWIHTEMNRTSKYRVVDNAGNISDEVTISYKLDWTPPVNDSVVGYCGDPFNNGATNYVRIYFHDDLSGIGDITNHSWDSNEDVYHGTYSGKGALSHSDTIANRDTWIGFEHTVCDMAGNCAATLRVDRFDLSFCW